MKLNEIWQLLAIETTTDRKIIKKAYAQRLKQINPRAEPAAFQALRQAYEAALHYAAGKGLFTKQHDDVPRAFAAKQFNAEQQLTGQQLAEQYLQIVCKQSETQAIQTFQEWQQSDALLQIGTLAEFETVMIYYLVRLKILPHESILFFYDLFAWDEKSKLVQYYQNENFQIILLYFKKIQFILSLSEGENTDYADKTGINTIKLIFSNRTQREEITKMKLSQFQLWHVHTTLKQFYFFMDNDVESTLYDLKQIKWLNVFVENTLRDKTKKTKKSDKILLRIGFGLVALIFFCYHIIYLTKQQNIANNYEQMAPNGYSTPDSLND